MPRTDLSIETASRTTPLDPTANAVDAANGNSFLNTGREILRIVNGSGVTLTVTVDIPAVYDGDLTITDRSYSIDTAETRIVGPFPTGTYNQTDNSLPNRVLLDWSTGTSVTVEVVKVPQV